MSEQMRQVEQHDEHVSPLEAVLRVADDLTQFLVQLQERLGRGAGRELPIRPLDHEFLH